jgi:hypothetical protein
MGDNIGNRVERCGLDNMRMDPREIWWESVEWMNLAQDMDQWQALVNMLMNLWVP